LILAQITDTPFYCWINSYFSPFNTKFIRYWF